MMKTATTNMDDAKASKELRIFGVLGMIFSVLGFAFWWLTIMGLGFSARSMLLTFHKANSKARAFKYLAAASMLVSLAILLLVFLYGFSND
jgi:hypothetical protein